MTVSEMSTIRYGSRGDDVKIAQTILGGVDVDGIFGKQTKAAVIAFQTANNLVADGIVGQKTWTALLAIADPNTIASATETKEDTTEFIKPVDYKQYDSKWGSIMYSNHNDKSQTIKSSGCGPTSGADIVATWWDPSITPKEMCEQSSEWKCRTYSSGTTGTFFTKLAAKYGASKYVRTSNMSTVISCLKTGGYVVVCFGTGTEGTSDYKKWTSGGHYSVIWKYDGTYFYINDTASAKASRAKGTYAEVKDARKGFYCFWK